MLYTWSHVILPTTLFTRRKATLNALLRPQDSSTAERSLTFSLLRKLHSLFCLCKYRLLHPVGRSKLDKMVYSGPFTPHIINDDCVTVEITYSTEHVCHEILVWSRVVLCNTPVLLLRHGCVHWVSHERREYRASIATATVTARRKYCYGCCTSQERFNVSAAPMAPPVSFLPLSSCLAYPRVQQTVWTTRQLGSQAGSATHIPIGVSKSDAPWTSRYPVTLLTRKYTSVQVGEGSPFSSLLRYNW